MLLLRDRFRASARECIYISVSTCLHQPQDLWAPAKPPNMLIEDIFLSVMAFIKSIAHKLRMSSIFSKT